MKKSAPTKPFQIRIPAPLRERLEKMAAEGHRSITSEILMRLEQTFQSTEHKDSP